MNNQLEKLGKVLSLLDDGKASTEEVVKAFELILETMAELRTTLIARIDNSASTLSEKDLSILSQLKDTESRLKELDKSDDDKVSTKIKELSDKVFESIKEVRSNIPKMPDLSNLERRVGEVESKKIPEIPIDLVNEAKLRVEIEALSLELQKKISQIPSRGVVGGARGIQLYVDGAKKGMANTINLIPGSGVSLTYNHASGRQDITISASGSGAFAVIEVTGTVDDTNTSFSAVTAPTIVIINGVSYRSAGDSITWTYVGTTLTLSQAVGSGGSIYAI